MIEASQLMAHRLELQHAGEEVEHLGGTGIYIYIYIYVYMYVYIYIEREIVVSIIISVIIIIISSSRSSSSSSRAPQRDRFLSLGVPRSYFEISCQWRDVTWRDVITLGPP